MADLIQLNGLLFYSYHGVQLAERELGQRFRVDLEVTVDLLPAGRADDLEQTVDYGELYDTVRKVFDGPPRQLLEALAEQVSAEVLRRFPRVGAVRVRVEKLSPPLPAAQSGTAAVTLSRQRAANSGNCSELR